MGIKYNPALDGLRAVAVLAVVLYHAGLPVPAGFVGVDVFFVISGYLITRLLADELPRIDFLHFYARRARRILPAMALVVGSTLLASLALLPDAHDAAQSAAAAAAFVANLFFQSKTGGYWSASAETMPLLHLWSLSVEEQFYLVWPVVLMLARKRPVAALWTLAVVSFLVAEALLWYSPNAAFYQMPARAWELAAGGLVALGAIRLRGAYIGLLIVLVACAVPIAHFPGVGALPAVLGATWLISALHHGERLPVLETRPIVFVGLISYSLYLWHWPLLALYRATWIGEAPLGPRMVLVGVAFLLAVATYRYVEQPFRKMQFPSGRTVAVGVLALTVLGVGACGVGIQATKRAASTDNPLALKAEQDMPPIGCHSEYFDKVVPKCPDPPGAKTALWGDSMGFAWRPAMRGPFIEYTMSGCSPLVGYLPAKPFPADYTCRDFNDKVLKRAEGLDTLILVANWNPETLSYLERSLSVAPKVRRVIVLGPTPSMHGKVPRCIRLHSEAKCALTRAEWNAKAAPILATIRGFAAKYPNVEVRDPTDYFCTPTSCPPVKNGVPMYWDTHHVTSTAARGYSLQ